MERIFGGDERKLYDKLYRNGLNDEVEGPRMTSFVVEDDIWRGRALFEGNPAGKRMDSKILSLSVEVG